MTKKDFIALGDALRASRPYWKVGEPQPQWEPLLEQRSNDVHATANWLESVNTRFDKARWLKYVGLPD